MRNSSYLTGRSHYESADDEPVDASFHLQSLLLQSQSHVDEVRIDDVDALARGMADWAPVRVAVLDTNLRIRALNAEWRKHDLPADGGLGRDFVRSCLLTAALQDREAVTAGLSRLQCENGVEAFSTIVSLRVDCIPRNFALRARKLPQTPDLIVVALLDVTDKGRPAAERRRVMRIVLDAEEAERKRIARELHDETVQQLAVMQIGIAGLREYGSGAKFDHMCRDIEEALKSVQKELRTLSYVLHPPEIDGGLVEALRNFVRGLARRTQLYARFVDQTKGLLTDEETDRALYRVAQEALINICKHAEATHAYVFLRERNQQLVLEIVDDGIGIPAELCSSRSDAKLGVGLAAMRERVEALSGRLEVSRLDQGTRILATLPFPRLFQ